jgi:hypothetical protein
MRSFRFAVDYPRSRLLVARSPLEARSTASGRQPAPPISR